VVTHPRIPCGTGKAHLRENEMTSPVRMGMRASSFPSTWIEYDRMIQKRNREIARTSKEGGGDERETLS
jgi:hypothetical protein